MMLDNSASTYLFLVIPRGGLAVTLGGVIVGNIVVWLIMMMSFRGGPDGIRVALSVSAVLLLAAFLIRFRVYHKIPEVAGR